MNRLLDYEHLPLVLALAAAGIWTLIILGAS